MKDIENSEETKEWLELRSLKQLRMNETDENKMGENNCQAISNMEDTALAIYMHTPGQDVGSNSHHGVYL